MPESMQPPAMVPPAMVPPAPILPPPPMMPPPAHLPPPQHAPHQVSPPNTFIPPPSFGGTCIAEPPPPLTFVAGPKPPQPPPAFGGKCCVCQRSTSYAYIVRSHHWLCKDHTCPHAPWQPPVKAPAMVTLASTGEPMIVIPADAPPTSINNPSNDGEVPLI